jgi:hypothetical protein
MHQFRINDDFKENDLHPFARYKYKIAREGPPGDRFMRMR